MSSETDGADPALLSAALATELDRRIHTISSADDTAFGGRLGPGEIVAAIVAFTILPALIVWLFR